MSTLTADTRGRVRARFCAEPVIAECQRQSGLPTGADPSDVGTFSIREATRRLGVGDGTVHRWLREGLTEDAADQAAAALNVHPASLWPEWFDAWNITGFHFTATCGECGGGLVYDGRNRGANSGFKNARAWCRTCGTDWTIEVTMKPTRGAA